jgi:hypothetical protein
MGTASNSLVRDEPGQQTPSCPNCGGDQLRAWCADCGQKRANYDQPFWTVAGEFLRETFEWDKRFPKTLRTLILRPGQLAADFIAGRRARNTSSVKLFLFSVLVLFAVMEIRGGLIATAEALPSVQIHVSVQGQDIAEAARLDAALRDAFSHALFLWIPLFAAALKILSWRIRYLHHLIFTLYQASAIMLGMAVGFAVGGWFAVAMATALAGHFLLALRTCYRSNWPLTLLRWATLVWVGLHLLWVPFILATFLVDIDTDEAAPPDAVSSTVAHNDTAAPPVR